MVNKRLSKIRPIAVAGAPLLLAATVFAGTAAATGIYRWVDADGTVHFGDSPPPDHPVRQIEVLPPPGSGPPPAEGSEAATDSRSSPEAVIVPGRFPRTD
jgi:hypothetical protein